MGYLQSRDSGALYRAIEGGWVSFGQLIEIAPTGSRKGPIPPLQAEIKGRNVNADYRRHRSLLADGRYDLPHGLH